MAMVSVLLQFTLFMEYSPAFEPCNWGNEFGGLARERPVLPDSAKRDVSDALDIANTVAEKGRHGPGLEAYLRDHPVAGVVARALAALSVQDDKDSKRAPATFLTLSCRTWPTSLGRELPPPCSSMHILPTNF